MIRTFQILILGLSVLFFLHGCTYNVSLVNGNKNGTEVAAPVEKDIPVTATLPVLP